MPKQAHAHAGTRAPRHTKAHRLTLHKADAAQLYCLRRRIHVCHTQVGYMHVTHRQTWRSSTASLARALSRGHAPGSNPRHARALSRGTTGGGCSSKQGPRAGVHPRPRLGAAAPPRLRRAPCLRED